MTDFKPRNILLFGATGNIGRYILDAIVSARSEFDRVVVFTSPSSLAAGNPKAALLNDLKANKQVEIIAGDIADEKAVGEAYQGINQSYYPPTKSKSNKTSNGALFFYIKHIASKQESTR
jgi:nucleoside-diphosphate-sugar epimerase